MLKKYLTVIVSLLALAGCTEKASVPVWFEGALNPLTYTDIPDNDVIRVGEDYYMVSTTMFFCPGAPIMHSKDLVHWRIVSYIYDCLEDDDIYNLRGGKNAYGAGQWATSLRYQDGVYYALFVANDQKKSYLYKTTDIVNGPWERTVFDDWFFHDPSLLFDDGRLWVVWGNGDLKLVELEPDGSAVKAGAKEKVILSAPSKGWGLRAEGAHFYHIGDYYYIIEIDWPKGGIRQATCWRSRNIDGPYESKVVLKGTLDGRDRDGIAQGPIVDLPDGRWYAIQFQDHGAIGRIPTLQKVTWVDGWPVMGDNGVPEQNPEAPLPHDGENYVWDSDEFDSEALALVWQWNHKAPEEWSLTSRPGWLTLNATPAESIASARGTLTQRTVGPRCVSETFVDGSELGVGDEAGICAFQSLSARIGLEKKADGSLFVVAREKEKTIFEKPLEGTSAHLKIRFVFTPVEEGDKQDTAFLSYSEDGVSWTEVPFTLKMKYTLDYFTGYRAALYCFGPGSGKASFDWFRQETY